MSEFWEHVARGSRGVRAAVALAGLWLGRTSVACGSLDPPRARCGGAASAVDRWRSATPALDTYCP